MPDLTTIFQTLREKGLGHITELAGLDWTDHNPSDPGITFLEQLCFALSDLEYRIDFDIRDLLAPGDDDAYSTLFTPRSILTTHPVVEDDFRRILMDLQGVKNATLRDTESEQELWYAPFSQEILLADDRDPLLPEDVYRPLTIKGLWNVQVEPHRNAEGEWFMSDVDDLVYQHLHQNRPVGVDYAAISLLAPQRVKVKLGIELGDNVNPESLLVEIWEILERYISPNLSFKGMSELLASKRIDEIFEGPALERGFLDPDEIIAFRRRSDLRRSDLIRELSKLRPGIKAIRELNIALDDSGYTNPAPWIVQLDPDKAPVFSRQESKVLFYRGELLVEVDSPDAVQIYETRKRERILSRQPAQELDIFPEKGSDREAERYVSIRQHMPELYGISPAGLPPGSEVVQQASARQLSAYLMFFEQLLANSFSQLANAWRLLSVNRADSQSYFIQAPDSVPASEGIFVTEDEGAREAIIHEASETQAIANNRTHRFLDHLLARFSETFTEYDFLFRGLSASYSSQEADPVIADKRQFLQNYPALSSPRGTGFDYRGDSWDTDNIAGLKRRVAGLLGISNIERADLVEGGEGFYLLEHILLRPRPGDKFQEFALMGAVDSEDPYSLQLSYVFPRRAGRYADLDEDEWTQFCDFVTRLLRAETPAHLQFSIIWMETDQLSSFGVAYQAFLMALKATSNLGETDPEDHQYALRFSRDRLLDTLVDANSEGEAAPALGTPFPMRDIPVPTTVDATPLDNPPTLWRGEIKIDYPQPGVNYVLTDRNRRPISPTISKKGDDPDGFEDGQPYLTLQTPEIQEEQTYWIRAEKLIGSEQRYVYLKQKVRVLIGITPIEVTVINQEIDYGQQTVVRLNNTQAGVDYLLFVGSTQINPTPVEGDPENPINIATEIPDGFREDTTIVVRGSRDNFNNDAPPRVVGSAVLKVSPNPNLKLSITPFEIVYGGGGQTLEALSDDQGNVTQASAIYRLYAAEIPDLAFVHQKDDSRQPPAEQLLVITRSVDSNEEEEKVVVAKIEKFPLSEWPRRIDRFTLIRDNAKVANDGDRLKFDIGPEPLLLLSEDTWFVVVATKPGENRRTVVLSDPQRARVNLAASLVYPDTSPEVIINPLPVPSGSRARVQLNNTQSGVRYFLRIDGVDQRFAYHFDQEEESPRRDGVGGAKVGTDHVVGPVTALPIIIQSDQVLTATTRADVIAEKAQTGLQAVIASIEITVT